MFMKIAELISYLDALVPKALQESYDNSGLLVGDKNNELTEVLVCLDVTEEVVHEAMTIGANLIVAHHPIIFSGLKSLTGSNYVERTVQLAIKYDISIYAIHTNLDNVDFGVNRRIAEKLGLKKVKVLRPMKGKLEKLVTFVPESHSEKVLQSMFKAGAGHIGNYSECSFSSTGQGTYLGSEESDPYAGEKGIRHSEAEHKIEVILPGYLRNRVVAEMKKAHPYEEVAYDVCLLENEWKERGAGMIGEFDKEMSESEFLPWLKEVMKTDCVRYTPLGRAIKKVAFCGGSGSFLLADARSQGADAFITGDFKYHDFFDAEGDILIADIGHYESEQFTIQLIGDLIVEKFANFAVRFTQCNTNPIKYI